MKIFSIRSVPTAEWSSEKPLNFSPKPLTVIILCFGLILFGLGESLIITASAGMSPWTVLAEGLSITTGLSIGALTFIISLGVLLLWIPLKQQAGVGTILNVIIIAAVIEWSLPYLPHPETYAITNNPSHCGNFVSWYCKWDLLNCKSWPRSQRRTNDWLPKSNQSSNCLGKSFIRNNSYFHGLRSWRNNWTCNNNLCIGNWSSGLIGSLLYCLNISSLLPYTPQHQDEHMDFLLLRMGLTILFGMR